jgi:catechol 2,3-dioxygenase-like lactoylglutathione lyase family enzyme/predicted enzyme related to lactoylglutathione lyase
MNETLTLTDASIQTTGPVHWIDHFVLNSEDVPRWAAFNTKILGAYDIPAVRGIFQMVGPTLIGAFPAKKPLPPPGKIGKGLPRYGYYINKADIAKHIDRLDLHGVAHSGVIATSADGEAGIAIYWQDPDGNDFEFWAPDAPPDGALNTISSEGVGRISHATFESRDLERTADFFKHYCDLNRLQSSDIAADTLVLPLASGSRIVYKNVDKLSGRTTGSGLADVHTALTVHQDSFFPNYRRIWDGLPEWGFDSMACGPNQTVESLPARTARHGSPEGRAFYDAIEKGDDFFDWDTNQFHLVGGTPADRSLSIYKGHTVGAYMAAWEAKHGSLDGFRAMVVG